MSNYLNDLQSPRNCSELTLCQLKAQLKQTKEHETERIKYLIKLIKQKQSFIK